MKCDVCGAEIRENANCGDGDILCRKCQKEASIRGALDAGIPMSVIEGKTKLTDHFSQEYIDYRAGKNGIQD